MYCGFPATLLTSTYLHGPTSVDHILFYDSSDAFANYSSNHLANTIAFVKRNKTTGYVGSMVSGSTNSVHSLLVSVVIDSHRLILHLLEDLHAKIPLKPLASTPEGPPDPLVLIIIITIIIIIIIIYYYHYHY